MPSEAAGVYTESLDRRFENLDQSYREKLLEAMRWEDNNLRKHVDKHRLDQWAKDTRKLAEDAVDQQFDQKTAAGASGSPTKAPKISDGTRNGRNGTH